MAFKVGDRVAVDDPGLAQLRAIMMRATDAEPPVNNVGTIDEIYDDGMLLIAFDEDGVEGAGNAAPYPPSEVRLVEDTWRAR
jgi:hypothetical protein